MGPKDVIKQTLDMSDFILHKYMDDLSDADLPAAAGRGDAPDRTSAWPLDRRRANV